MILAIAIGLGSIALGTGLGLLPGSSPRAASPFRTFAMVTAVAVVLGQLLPEALGEIGIAALGAFAAGFFAPRVAERLAAALSRPACVHDDAMCTDLGLELGYVGLVLHHVGDGIGLGLYAGPLHAGHDHYDVVAALAAHTVPLAALMALAFKTHRGAFSAALRAVGIAVSMLAGLLLATIVPSEHLSSIEPWLTAIVAGLLLHIVAHGWPEERHPTASSRLMDFLAIFAGLAILALGGHSDAAERGLPDLREQMGRSLVELGLATAPMLLAGLAIAAVLQTQGARIPARFLKGGGRFGQALRGALLGVPLPVCACGVLPIAHSLRRRGAAAALVVAFLLAAPELGVDTFALTARFMGVPFALLRVAGALLVAFVAALLVGAVAREGHSVHAHADHDHGHGGRGHDHDDPLPFRSEHHALHGPFAEIAENFDDLLYHVGAWTLVGLIAAAYMQATLGTGALQSFSGPGLDIVVVTVLALPSYVCATSATPLAAVLIGKGISPGAVLCGLLLGPATNVATVAWLRKAFGARATWFGLVGLLLATWGLAVIANRVLAGAPVAPAAGAGEHEHGVVVYVSTAAVLLLLARSVFRNGLRTWLGSLGEALSTSHDHPGHVHVHTEHEAH